MRHASESSFPGGIRVSRSRSPAPGTRQGRLATALTAGPAVLIAVVCCAMPLVWMATAMCLNPEVWRELRVTPWRAGLIARTLGYNGLAAVIATAMGLPAGLVLGRGRGWLARALWLLMPAALLMPSLSYAYGWSQFVRLLRLGVAEGSGWAYARAQDPRPVEWFTLLGITLVSLWAGLIVGLLGIARFVEGGRSRSARLACVALPTALLYAAVAWTPLGGPAGQLLGKGLLAIFGRFYDGPDIQLGMMPGGPADTFRCIWSLAAWLWAIPAALVGLALRRMDADVQQQAVLDGVLYRITLRQLLGTIVASVAVVTVLATQEFAVYEPTGISVVATEVRMVFDTGSVSSPDNSITATLPQGGGARSPDQAGRAAAAVATALPLVTCTALLAAVAVWGAGRTSAAEALTVGPWPRVLDAPPWASAIAVALLLLNVGLPVWSLVASLRVSFSISRIWAEFGPQVQGAIFVAVIAAALAGVSAASAAGRWTPGLMAVGVASFLIGGQLLAIALIRIYNHRVLDVDRWMYNAWPVPVLAYVGRFGWLAVAGARGTWSRPWRELRDMASLDGAGTLATAAGIVWPLAWPTLAAGALLVGALSLTEVPATVLLFPQHPQVLTPTLMTWVHMARFDSMIEASLLMMLTVLIPAAAALALLAVSLRLARLRLGMRAATMAVGLLVLLAGVGCDRGSSTPDAIWLDTGTGPGQVVYPRGLAYSPLDDTIFLVDRMARVQHLDRDGHFINAWSLPEKRNGKPVGLSVGPDGNVYVPDTHYYRVIVYSPAGKELRRWGSFGRGPGQFIYPTDVEFDRAGRCFVSEYGDDDRIQVFDRDGKFLYQFGSFGQGDGQFIRPQDMVIDGGTVYVTDACNHRICVFTVDGKWVRNMGSCGAGPGQFRFPYGMDIDREGNLVVSEFGNNRVQRIDKLTGRGLGTWPAATPGSWPTRGA
jgi:DNA-binding beta-propeller fold protein YncE/ABC-type Fe3+ transport system permease subunit